MRTNPLVLALLGSALAALAWGQGSRDTHRDGDHADLRSEHKPTRDAAARAVLEERRLLIDVLCVIVQEKSEGDYNYEKRSTAESAIRLLGQIRAAEAAPLLAKKLRFPKPSNRSRRPPLPFREALPAVAALIEIGLPAVEPILQEVETSDDLEIMRCAALTLDRILETDPAVAAIDARIKDQDDHDVLRRLRRLRQRIDEGERLTTD